MTSSRIGENTAILHPESMHEVIARIGPSALSDVALLSVLLFRQGDVGSDQLVRQAVDKIEGIIGLAFLDMAALRHIGFSGKNATRIMVAFEFSRRLSQVRRRERIRMTTPEAVMSALGTSMTGMPHEELWCLPLDSQSRLIGDPRVVSKGDVDGTDAGPRAFWRIALTAGAVSAIAVHNHPGGDPHPSQADHAVTKRISDAGRILECHLADHVIVGDGGRFTSLRRTDPDLFRG